MFWSATPKVSTDEAKIEELLTRGVHEVIPGADTLRKVLRSGKQLRIKLGFDPTGERIHVGHSAPLLKLRDFQQLGHKVVFIVGDFTAVIGDTSDKESERPMLTNDAIEKNMATWKLQVGKILDLSKAEFRYNSEWLGKLTYREIGEHADAFSVSDFVARENIKRRLDAGKRVSLREVLYPLMQGYDSVAVEANVEIGGTDQRFNLLAGRVLQEKYKQQPQNILTLALLTDATGKKMSKTGGATVYVTDTPDDMFGKTMSVPDELVRQYFISMTRLPMSEVDAAVVGHPKEAKMRLGSELVRMYHGEAAASEAKANFDRAFTKGGVPENVPEVAVGDEGLMDALVAARIVESKSDYRRLLSDGAIRIVETDEKISERSLPPYGQTLRIGKHRFVKVVK
ncbi:MAG: tyrosine--tRNA ligase [Patescibacteria group bacterium]|mgnify:CR=1 FL=1